VIIILTISVINIFVVWLPRPEVVGFQLQWYTVKLLYFTVFAAFKWCDVLYIFTMAPFYVCDFNTRIQTVQVTF